jgi:WD40 repeat protein
VKYSPTGEIVYHTAGVGIVLDYQQNKQDFIFEHNNDIICLDMRENIAVTGQVGENPLICVWDYRTMKAKAVFQGVLKRGICHVAISHNGKMLAACGMDPDHCIVIYDLEKVLRGVPLGHNINDYTIAVGNVTKANIMDLSFDISDEFLIAACNQEINFIWFKSGMLEIKPGHGWGNNPKQAILSIGFLAQSIITGTFKGQLYVWKSCALSNIIPAHSSAVYAMHSRENGLITAGADGLIIYWDLELQQQKIIDIKLMQIGLLSHKIRAISENKQKNIIFGTRASELVLIE